MTLANACASLPVLTSWLGMLESGVPTICSRARSLRTWSRPLKPTTVAPMPKAISTTLAAMPAYWKSLDMIPILLLRVVRVDGNGAFGPRPGHPQPSDVSLSSSAQRPPQETRSGPSRIDLRSGGGVEQQDGAGGAGEGGRAEPVVGGRSGDDGDVVDAERLRGDDRAVAVGEARAGVDASEKGHAAVFRGCGV